MKYVKWVVGILGLFTAIYTSRFIIETYVEKDLIAYAYETGLEPSIETREELRRGSVKSAAVHILFFMFGVMASCAWLVFPKKFTTNEKRENT